MPEGMGYPSKGKSSGKDPARSKMHIGGKRLTGGDRYNDGALQCGGLTRDTNLMGRNAKSARAKGKKYHNVTE